MEPIAELGEILAGAVGSFCFRSSVASNRVNVVNRVCTASPRFVTRYRLGPVALVVRAWAWLAEQRGNLAEQKRYLKAIAAFDRSLDWAQAVLTRVVSVAEGRLR
jgi:hypothetical protein